MNKKHSKSVLIVICVILIAYVILNLYVNCRIRTSDTCLQLIDFLKTDNEITDVCGEFHNASFWVSGTIKYGQILMDTDKSSGSAVLRIKFKAENGRYIILANLIGTDGVWTVSDYQLTQRDLFKN